MSIKTNVYTFLEPDSVMPVMFFLLSLSVKSRLSGAPVISLTFLSPSASMHWQCLAMEAHDSSVTAQLERSRLSNVLPVFLVSWGDEQQS